MLKKQGNCAFSRFTEERSSYKTNGMENIWEMRRQEIEYEVLELEEKVWKSIYQEQLAILAEEKGKLKELWDSTHQMRSAYCTEVAKMRECATNQPLPTAKIDEQLQTELLNATQAGEIAALQREIDELQHTVDLLEEQKHLQWEQSHGEEFSRVRAALKQERERCAELERAIGRAVESRRVRVGSEAGGAGCSIREEEDPWSCQVTAQPPTPNPNPLLRSSNPCSHSNHSNNTLPYQPAGDGRGRERPSRFVPKKPTTVLQTLRK